MSWLLHDLQSMRSAVSGLPMTLMNWSMIPHGIPGLEFRTGIMTECYLRESVQPPDRPEPSPSRTWPETR